MLNRFRIAAAAGALAVGGVLGLYFAGPAIGAGVVSPVEVSTTAIALNNADPALDRVGRLRYLGGLVLTSRNMRFGGLSDMLWEDGCDRLLAVTDTGSWIVLQPEERDGRLVGISAAWIAPLKAPGGEVPVNKRLADAEGLARMPDGSTWVSYEQVHRLERFAAVSACNPESLDAAPDSRWAPPEMAPWPANGGAEAIAAHGKGLVILAESQPGPKGGRMGLSGSPETGVRTFSWQSPSGFEPTAMARLNEGGDEMLVLHRRFTPLEGVSAVLSLGRFPDDLPEVVESVELARLRPPFNVDNMEALAVRKEGERRFIYMMSDNNFNALQRNLLLKFELLPAPEPKP